MTKLEIEIVSVLKGRLKISGLTYMDVSTHLGVSESSIKKLFSNVHAIPLSKLEDISSLANVSVSNIIYEAENNLSKFYYFNDSQDELFTTQPHLYKYFWYISRNSMNYSDILKKESLSDTELYIYLRELEKVDLIEMLDSRRFKLLVSRSIAFKQNAKFSIHFREKMINTLKGVINERLCNHKLTPANDAYFLSMPVALTQNEFSEYKNKCENLQLELLRKSEGRLYGTDTCYDKYVFVNMGAKLVKFSGEEWEP